MLGSFVTETTRESIESGNLAIWLTTHNASIRIATEELAWSPFATG